MRKRVTEWRLCTNTKDITHSALGDTCWQSEVCESVHAGQSMYTVSHWLRRLEGNTATSLKHQKKSFKSLWLHCFSTIKLSLLSLYGGTTDTDVTQQSHDSVETTNTGLTLLSNNITAGGGFFFFLSQTHKHSNLGFRTDSFREMFFLEAGWKYQLMRGRREKERRRWRRRRRED